MRQVKWSELAKVVGRDIHRYREAAHKSAVLTAMVDAPALIQQSIASTIVAGQIRPPVDQGQYRQGWKTRETEDGVLIYNSTPHAAVIEHGRRPGKFPPWSNPDQALGLWVRRKLLPAALAEKAMARRKHVSRRKMESRPDWFATWKGLSFVVARKIAKQGTEPRRVLQRAEPAIYAAWHRNFKAMVRSGK